MKKISIFSREYEKRIRRKRFAILLMVIIFFASLVGYIVNFSQVNDYVKDFYYSMVTKQVLKDEQDTSLNAKENNKLTQDTNDENDKNQNQFAVVDNLDLGPVHSNKEVKLSDNEILNVVYYKNGDEVEFQGIDESFVDKYKVDISPNKKLILIDDFNNQNTYLVDSNFNVYNLDPEFFYSNSAKARFYKKDVMSNYENYVWYKNPKFMDDNTIVYVSNLPWFGKNEQYVWKTDVSNLNDLKYFMTSVAGQNIDFVELTEEGIKVNINNEIKLLTFSFVLK